MKDGEMVLDLKWTGVTEGQTAKHQDSRCTKSERVKLKQQGIPKMMESPSSRSSCPVPATRGAERKLRKTVWGSTRKELPFWSLRPRHYAWIPWGFPGGVGVCVWGEPGKQAQRVSGFPGKNIVPAMSHPVSRRIFVTSASKRITETSHSRGHWSIPPPEPTLDVFFLVFSKGTFGPRVACGPWKL